MVSKLIHHASKRFHHSSLESSFKKGRIAFTALSVVVSKVISFVMLSRVVDGGGVPDTSVTPVNAEYKPELIKETANIQVITDLPSFVGDLSSKALLPPSDKSRANIR